jgi:DNA-binding transcriptional ArsR family regulator
MTRDGGTARLCRGLGNPIRLQILNQLASGQCSVKEVVESLGLEQSRVSKHLAVLLEVRLVRCDVDGRRRCYSLVQPRGTRKLLSLLEQMSRE